MGVDDEVALAEEQRERGLEETLETLGFGTFRLFEESVVIDLPQVLITGDYL